MQNSLSERGLLLGALLLAGSAHAGGDAVRGLDVFKAECAECHSAREGKHKKGPSLFGIMGRKAASQAGVEYSEALKGTGWSWTEERLRAYLARPVSQSNPGGKMKYDGLADSKSLDDVLAYLQAVK